MKTPLFLTALLLSMTLLSVVPLASANHCAQYPLDEEVYCIVNEQVGVDRIVYTVVDIALQVLDRVECFPTTAPADWVDECV